MLGARRPATAAVNKFLSLEKLEVLFEEWFAEYKDKVLGSDARLLNCGYVDTTSGCVMTSDTVMHITRSKRAADVRKRAQEQQKQLQRPGTADERLQVHLQAVERSNVERCRVRAMLCGTSVEFFNVRQRPMSLKRAIAGRRAAVGRQTFS